MARRGSADDAAGDRRAGHLRGAFRDLVAELEILLDAVEILLAEIVPDRGDRRYDVRLIAAVGNHIMGPLLGAEMLAAHVPADVHQLHPVKRGAAPPGCASGMAAVALECILDRNAPGARRPAPGRFPIENGGKAG